MGPLLSATGWEVLASLSKIICLDFKNIPSSLKVNVHRAQTFTNCLYKITITLRQQRWFPRRKWINCSLWGSVLSCDCRWEAVLLRAEKPWDQRSPERERSSSFPGRRLWLITHKDLWENHADPRDSLRTPRGAGSQPYLPFILSNHIPRSSERKNSFPGTVTLSKTVSEDSPGNL